ncbi:MAG: hypothetical protein PUB19_02325 [Lachnospiraceae bacterium]|nr:hypothetical protein [Lachnospiraceae bacterium]
MKREQIENNISKKRLGYVVAIVILFLLGISFMAYQSELLLDELLCLMTINLVFLLVLIIALMKKRTEHRLPVGDATSYRSIFLMLLLAWVFTIVFSYLPDYFAPVMIIGVLLTTVLDDVMALSLGIYFIIIQCVTCGLSVNVFYCYCILAMLGILLSSFLSNRQRAESFHIYIIYFLVNMLVPIVFYYIAYLEIDSKVFLYATLNGLCNCAVIIVFYSMISERTKESATIDYLKFIDERYPLVDDIKKFSMAEYRHARRVSKLAAFCASAIGANADCAACGGFYYRLGKMEGEPEIDNALKLANNHCFPTDVMEIMEEYGGVIRLPQTPESAIVHMVDTLVTKIELLDRDTMSSTWNQDMVIYQTLNELSQKGFYDESKMSINQFLTIREKLVQEESLL